jgi:hypothetical protein
MAASAKTVEKFVVVSGFTDSTTSARREEGDDVSNVPKARISTWMEKGLVKSVKEKSEKQ